MITKEYLEEKLITLTKDLEIVRSELRRYTILERKFEGGIEIINALLNKVKDVKLENQDIIEDKKE